MRTSNARNATGEFLVQSARVSALSRDFVIPTTSLPNIAQLIRLDALNERAGGSIIHGSLVYSAKGGPQGRPFVVCVRLRDNGAYSCNLTRTPKTLAACTAEEYTLLRPYSYKFNSGGLPHAKSKIAGDHAFVRCDIGSFIHGYGRSAKTGPCLMLQNETLLLRKQALLQKSESRLLHGQTYGWRRMLLQEGFVSHAANHNEYEN